MNDAYFNKEFKMQYLDENEYRNINIKTTVDLLFRRIANTERLLNKDLYDFSVEEILGFYKYLSTPSLESLMIMNNQYKLYSAYALNRGLIKDNQNHYAEIDNETLKSCVHAGLAKAKIITRSELLDILNSSYVENVSDKVIALSIFEGIAGKELTELTHMEPDDIDMKSNIVNLYGGRKLKISDKLKEWCLESANEYNYYNSTNKMSNKSYQQFDTRVIKRLSNSTIDSDLQRHKTINRRLDHLIDITGCNAFGVGSLKESGRLEMINDLVKSGMSLHDALKNDDMIYRYGKITSIKRYCIKFDLDF